MSRILQAFSACKEVFRAKKSSGICLYEAYYSSMWEEVLKHHGARRHVSSKTGIKPVVEAGQRE